MAVMLYRTVPYRGGTDGELGQSSFGKKHREIFGIAVRYPTIIQQCLLVSIILRKMIATSRLDRLLPLLYSRSTGKPIAIEEMFDVTPWKRYRAQKHCREEPCLFGEAHDLQSVGVWACGWRRSLGSNSH